MQNGAHQNGAGQDLCKVSIFNGVSMVGSGAGAAPLMVCGAHSLAMVHQDLSKVYSNLKNFSGEEEGGRGDWPSLI